jgi:exopolysaccharide/PEP-CTERM locus tyrosine autokinase
MFDFQSQVRAPLPVPPVAAPKAPPAPVTEREPNTSEAMDAPAQPKPRKQPVLLSQVEVSYGDPAPAVDEDETLELATEEEPVLARTSTGPEQLPVTPKRSKVDRASLREGGFILPDAPVGSLAEEFRIIKRQLLQAASGATGIAEDKRQSILVCSAGANEGKTFCAVNLAISMANEKDVEVLLVDGDFSKPEILSVLGLEGGPGLIDAIGDPAIDPESLIIQTDIKRLSVLPAGKQANNVTELLASKRTRKVLDALTDNHPKRIVIFDSPPALMASPASILAGKVGQIVMVVRADKTTEAELREAIGLLSGCDNISLMLNGTGFTASGRRFGTYYGFGQ